ncbi:DUF4743 domain-containing protein [Aquabacterium sp.]|uniref:NUDIX hydrolase n=1 Tax=Aquabacterium sp. TaxID=1872578 RepID=UPI0037847661
MSGQSAPARPHPPARWHALPAARAQAVARVPFRIAEGGRAALAGSVARQHLAALARWPEALRIDDDGGAVTLTVAAAERDACFGQLNQRLREAGLIRAWRDETYPVHALDGSGALLARFERAASRFWGTLTFGAHADGYIADAAGRPQRLWLARRSFSKPTDPGLLDNLVGAGVPFGQGPGDALLREAWEEAGLQPPQLRGLRAGHVLRLQRDIPEGLQLEDLSVYDLPLPPDLQPVNQDGEVAEWHCLPVAEALALAATDAMTVDAGLVTLDFALRRALLPAEMHGPLAAALTPLRVGSSVLPVQSN